MRLKEHVAGRLHGEGRGSCPRRRPRLAENHGTSRGQTRQRTRETRRRETRLKRARGPSTPAKKSEVAGGHAPSSRGAAAAARAGCDCEPTGPAGRRRRRPGGPGVPPPEAGWRGAAGQKACTRLLRRRSARLPLAPAISTGRSRRLHTPGPSARPPWPTPPAGLSRLPQCLLAPWAVTAVCPRPNAPELDLGAPARPHPPAPGPSPQPQPSAAPPGPWRSRLHPAGSPFKTPPPRPPPAAPGRPAVPARSTLRPGAPAQPGPCIAVPTALQGTCSLRLLAMRRWRCPGDGLRPPRPRFLPGPPEGWPARGPRV